MAAVPLLDKPRPPSRSLPRGRPSSTNPPPPGVLKRYVCHWNFDEENKPQCQSSFDRKSDLKRHQCIHSGRKDYRCRMCGKAFVQSSALHVHERTHTGERPHACGNCEKSFADSSSLARHRKTHDPQRHVGRRSKKKCSLVHGDLKVEEGSDDSLIGCQDSNFSHGFQDKEAPGRDAPMEQDLLDFADDKRPIHRGSDASIFTPQSNAEHEVSRGPMVTYDTAPHVQMPTVGRPYQPDGLAPTDYSTMLDTSVPPGFTTHSPVPMSGVDEMRPSNPLEPTHQGCLYQVVGATTGLSARDKRDLLRSVEMYGPPLEQMPPTSRPSHWPQLEAETGMAPPTASQHTSPSTTTSEVPRTPEDFRIMQRPKEPVATGPVHQERFMQPDMRVIKQEAPPPPPPPQSQTVISRPLHQPARQQQAAPPPPQQPLQQNESQYASYQPPLPVHWEQHPEAAVLGHLDQYPNMAQYGPIDAGVVRSLGGVDQFNSWAFNDLGVFGVDEDKVADTFGEQMPSQAFDHF